MNKVGSGLLRMNEKTESAIPFFLINWKWTKEGEEPITRQQGSNATIDWLTKKMKGLSGQQAYELKHKRKLDFMDERGWRVEISIEETNGKDLGRGAGESLPSEAQTNAG